MNTTLTEQGAKTLVNIDGRIDTASAKDFETALLPLYEKANPDIEINCEKLSYISSSGLRVFLALQKKVMANNGQLVLKNLSEGIMDVFKMTGFSSIFKIE